MKKLLFFLFLLFTISLHAQTSVVGRIEAEILTPVSAVETDLLNFGRLVVENGGGTITLSPYGTRTYTGQVMLVDDNFSSGKFVLAGLPESLVSIILPVMPQTLRQTTGNRTITVSQFTSNIPSGGHIARQSDGKAEINVGATLYVGGVMDGTGIFAGSYEVVFGYN